jgi:hypothetical protein
VVTARGSRSSMRAPSRLSWVGTLTARCSFKDRIDGASGCC